MKKYLRIYLAILLLIINIQPAGAAEIESGVPAIESEAAVLMDAQTGQVLYEKNMDEQLYPASITKIMTVLLGVENSSLQDTVTMSHQAVFSIELGAAHIALDEGEQINMEQALMAAMLPSANEACNGIAEHISGSIPDFVRMMNQRAAEAGARHTNFANANGLADPRHLTTAYDMAVITQAAIQNPEFRRIFGTSHYVIPPTNKQPETRYLWAEHKMFECGRYEYKGVTGGKTGYTKESGNTLVTLAQRGERELIAVVLKSANSGVYKDTTALLDYGFDQFNDTTIIMPALTDSNLNGITGNPQVTEQIAQQVQEISATRLLHKSINPDQVLVAYTLLSDTASDNPQVQIHMSLNNQNNYMYSDLGVIVVQINLPVKTAGNKILNILGVIMKILLSIIIILFSIRWYFKIKRGLRRKRHYLLDQDRIRLPIK